MINAVLVQGTTLQQAYADAADRLEALFEEGKQKTAENF